jgi:protocatechuate 3,4-dioxygenase beta subunit
MNDDQRFPSRRRILTSGAFAATGLVLAKEAFAQPGLAPTPSCHDGDDATLPEIEGPFFKPKSPRRSDLREPGMAGRPVELSGVVLTRACRPVAGVLVDLWQADASGAYDNRGFRLRGHVFTDAAGRYAFHTIVPGIYPGRTRHYHVKVQAPNKPVLTTQFRENVGDLPRQPLLLRRGVRPRWPSASGMPRGRLSTSGAHQSPAAAICMTSSL